MADKADKNAQNIETRPGSSSTLFDDLESIVDDVFQIDPALTHEEEKKSGGSDQEDAPGDLFSQTDTLSGCLDTLMANSQDAMDISLEIPAVLEPDETSSEDIRPESEEPNQESGLFKSFSLGSLSDDRMFDFDSPDLAVVDVVDDLLVKSSDLDVLDASMVMVEEEKESEKVDTRTPNRILDAVTTAETTFGADLSADSTLQVNVETLALLSKYSDEDDQPRKEADEARDEDDDDRTVVADVLTNDLVHEASSDESEDSEDITADFWQDMKSEPDAESESESDAGDDETDEPVVQLSERAKKGQFYPTEEVQEADLEVGESVEYSENLCEAVKDPEIQKASVKRNMIRVIVGLVLLCFVGVAVLISYEMLTYRSEAYVTAQTYGFDAGGVHWSAFSSSRDGRWVAVCNDGRGAVYRDDKYVSSFFPHNGCQAIQIADDGSFVAYVGRNGYLSKFSLASNMGFVEESVGAFEGLASNVFTIHPSSLAYLSEDETGSVLVHSSRSGDSEALPPDALICFGSSGERMAYLSGLELNIIRNGQPRITASLDDAKLACPRELAIDCAYDGEDGWVAVCRGSYVIGRGSSVSARDQYHFESVYTGVDALSIQRHSDGVEIVLPQKWISIAEKGVVREVELSDRLQTPMFFVKRSHDLEPLVGLNGGRLVTITETGVISDAPDAAPGIVAAGFVSDGKKVVGVWNAPVQADQDTAQGSYLVFWNLDTASLENRIELDGHVLGLNISKSGRMGYVVTQADPLKLTWISWDNFEKMSEMDIPEAVTDTVWSADDQHAILTFASGRTGVWGKHENVMTPLIQPDAGVSLAFHSNAFVWELNYAQPDAPRVRMQRIQDGLYSVDFEKIESALRNQAVTHVTTNPYSRFILFWGEGGLWRYDALGDNMAQIVDKPVQWLSLSNGGGMAATNLGVIDLVTKDVRRSLYPNDVAPLLWSGDDKYLESRDGGTFYALDGQQNILFNRRVLNNVRFIGEGAGITQHSLRTLAIRDNVVTVEGVRADASKILAAISGFDSEAWCWMTSDGKAQGKAGVCAPLKKYEVEQEMPPVEPFNADVIASTSVVSPVEAILRDPVAVAKFVDSVKLDVQAVPADAQVLFGVSEGDRPEELVPDEGTFFDLPFATTLKTSDRGFAAVFYKPGYVMRTVQFDIRASERILKVVLLKEAYSDITVVRHDSDDELSEDTSVAIANFVGDNREALSACLAPSDGTRFLKVEVNEKCQIEPSDDMEGDECLKAAFQAIQQPESCDAMIGLEESVFEKFDIIFP